MLFLGFGLFFYLEIDWLHKYHLIIVYFMIARELEIIISAKMC